MYQLVTLGRPKLNPASRITRARAAKDVIRTHTISHIHCPLGKEFPPSHNLTMTAKVDGIALLEMQYIHTLFM